MAEDEGTEGRNIVVSGSADLLKQFADMDTPALTQHQRSIVTWYGALVRMLKGPSEGNEREPAGSPPWVTPGPRIDSVTGPVSGESTGYVVVGRGFATTHTVRLDGEIVQDWQVQEAGNLIFVPMPGDEMTPTNIAIGTRDGDVYRRLDADSHPDA